MANSLWLPLESRNERLLGTVGFARRMGMSLLISAAMIAISLVAGMAGYHRFEHMTWIDAFANASMILSGMGPLAAPQTWGGKLFAGLYALYSGLALILATGIIIAPIVHRVLHRFHLEAEGDGEK